MRIELVGVLRHRTCQQNGVAERKNCTVVELERSLLNERGFPVHFRGEALVAIVYLLNISPTKSVLDRTPYEAWKRHKPRVSHSKEIN